MGMITLPLPGIARVVDTEDEHGMPVKILYLFDQRVAYYVGEQRYMSNDDWEDTITFHIARFFARMLCEGPLDGDWSERNPTGNDIYSTLQPVEYIQERYDNE